MPTAQSLERLHKLIWTLIYAGLLTLVLGIAVHRGESSALGYTLMVGGGVVAAVGFVLIYVRSLLKESR